MIRGRVGGLSITEAFGGLLICLLVALFGDDSQLTLSVFVLLLGLKLVWTGDGLFVLPAAYAFHWVETSIGLIYRAAFGREVPTFVQSDYRPMVLIALGCCLALAVGIRLGLTLIKVDDRQDRPEFAFSFGFVAITYIISIFFEGTLIAIAADYPSVRQIIVTADTARLGILFLLLRRLLTPTPRWFWIGGILALEVTLGITGFFAGFREPLVLGALALLEIFDRRNAKHWAALTAAMVAGVAIGLLWMGIRGEYRRNFIAIDNFETSRSARLQSIEALSMGFLHADSESTWETADTLVDRMWTVYYPALAVERVPATIPHTHGEILSAALVHIVTPRVFFPGKPELQSESEKVRKYSGVFVAGAEQNTSIAFGYAAEAYVDFGVPVMFIPVLAFGLAMGCTYRLFERLIMHRELFVAFGTVAFWMSLYLFERSWATMLGIALGMMVYLGGPVVLLDRFLMIRHDRDGRNAEPLLYGDEHPSSL
ncbi:MAG TPA: hypothetical protein VH583_24185 [Vicinamibacterales bacterium]